MTRRRLLDPAERHGGNVVRLSRQLGADPAQMLDFSSNAYSLANDLTAAILGSIPYPHEHYPDPDSLFLREALAAHEATTPDRVLPGNGSSELIYLALTALAPESVLIVAPVFSEYVRACEGLDIPYEMLILPEHADFLPGPADLDRLASWQGDLLVLCTPNNPTGAVFPALENLFPRLRCRHALVDATYREFLYGRPAYRDTDHPSLRRLLPRDTGLITLHSLTKFFHCTGLRLGYALTDPACLDRMERRRAPWMVSRFAELAGAALLARIDAYRARLLNLEELKSRFAEVLARTGAFDRIRTGELNFVLARVRGPETAPDLTRRLAAGGVLVRCCDTIPGMPPGWIRLQVRAAPDQDRLAHAITSR